MSPTCPVLYSPMLTTADTETFMATIKKQSSEQGRRYECVYNCAAPHTCTCILGCVYSVCKCNHLGGGGGIYWMSTGAAGTGILLYEYRLYICHMYISVCGSPGCIVPRSCQTPTWCSWSPMPRRHVCRVTPGRCDRLNNPVSFHSARKKKQP